MSLKIPNDFHSDTDEQPFVNCKVCDRDLTNEKVPYSVEKAFKRTPEGEDVTLFEIAICLPCAEEQAQKMSQESQQYLAKMMGNQEIMEKRGKRWDTDWRKNWKEACLFTDAPIQQNDEYHIVGQFKGGKLMQYQTPFVIGQEFIEKVQENLSVETKEEMDDFGDQFLGPDPRIKALMEDYQFVMV